MEKTLTTQIIELQEEKPGYKKTKFGWIPEDWEIVKLGDASQIDSDNLTSNTDPNYVFRYISLSDIQNKKIQNTLKSVRFKDAPSRAKRVVKKGDILLATVRPNLKSFAYVELNDKDLIASTGFAVITPSSSFDGKYLFNFILGQKIEAQIYSLVVGSNYPAINSSDIRNLKIFQPPIKEQVEIGRTIELWIRSIFCLEQLIKQKQLHKNALMQQLLTGKKRLPGFNGEWGEKKLSELFIPIIEKNDGSKHEPLSISAGKGFVSQKEKFDRVIAGTSLKNYIKIEKGDFVYNKGNSKKYKMGCIYLLESFEKGLVPFVFISFRPRKNLEPAFYKHYFINHGLDRQLKRIITSGARGDGLLNVSKDDFFNINVPYFDLNEQNKIGKILDDADQEIVLLKKKKEMLQNQKKGLMQQLLTGKKRINQ